MATRTLPPGRAGGPGRSRRCGASLARRPHPARAYDGRRDARDRPLPRRPPAPPAMAARGRQGRDELAHRRRGRLHRPAMWALARGVETLCAGDRRQAVIVSSGAGAVGRERLGLTLPLTLPEKQAAAAVGQALLMLEWERALAPKPVAQLLLSVTDVHDRERYVNAKHALEATLRFGVVPVVNENDSVATAELRVGDNDTLSAWTAYLVDADALVIVTDVAGLFERDPRLTPGASPYRGPRRGPAAGGAHPPRQHPRHGRHGDQAARRSHRDACRHRDVRDRSRRRLARGARARRGDGDALPAAAADLGPEGLDRRAAPAGPRRRRWRRPRGARARHQPAPVRGRRNRGRVRFRRRGRRGL
jgi:hypothetical protein